VSNSNTTSFAAGVLGVTNAQTGDASGVYGQTNSSGSRTAGVFGEATSPSGSTTGIWGRTVSPANGARAIFGEATAATGPTVGVWGVTNSGSNDAAGVYGEHMGSTGNGAGVWGQTRSTTNNASGVFGEARGGGGAVHGVFSRSTSAAGAGVFGDNTNPSGFAGLFNGKVQVNGSLTARVVQITGADFSEKFEVREAKGRIEPGMVVAIDPAHPGQLVVSAQAYNRRVAGILSGAGGIHTGMLMGQPGTLADGDHPVALSGRVYVWADASNGAIQPGDLLTTSNVPGHAMKVTHYTKAQGAILGKAMTGLAKGRGLVLVLVTLQ